MKILVLDTETTGLPLEKKPSIFDYTKWPHIIQLSYILYDTNNNTIMCLHDHIISIDKDAPLSDESITIHGITRKISENNGINIKDALVIFNICLNKADIIIGHNLVFDKNILIVESLRNKVPQYFIVENKEKAEYCTMRKGKGRCKIIVKPPQGDPYYKFPSLLQLHQHLFEVKPKGLHNSLVDVLICLRCYYFMVYGEDICGKNRKINSMIRKLLI